MLLFVLLLLMAAVVQILGGALSWLFVKLFCRRLGLILLIEMSLMLFVSVLLIGEGLTMTQTVIASTLLGLAAMAALDRIIPHRHETKVERVGLLVFVAMCLHEFPEGVAAGSAYVLNPVLGIAAAALIALHNIPEGSIITMPYFMKKRFSTGMKAVLATQALYVAGGLLGYFLLVNVSGQLQALAMTFAAGAMLYIIGEELMWMKNKELCG